jgi:hypothetical protein
LLFISGSDLKALLYDLIHLAYEKKDFNSAKADCTIKTNRYLDWALILYDNPTKISQEKLAYSDPHSHIIKKKIPVVI